MQEKQIDLPIPVTALVSRVVRLESARARSCAIALNIVGQMILTPDSVDIQTSLRPNGPMQGLCQEWGRRWQSGANHVTCRVLTVTRYNADAFVIPVEWARLHHPPLVIVHRHLTLGKGEMHYT